MAGDWILYPLVQCGLLAAGLLLCLYLFLSAKREARRAGLRAERSRQALEERIQTLQAAVDGLRAGLEELEERSDKLVEPPPAASGLNLTKRSQALRMHRRGEAPENIAAALLLPPQEVELLLKVDQMAAGPQP
jgi:hypothetical protein